MKFRKIPVTIDAIHFTGDVQAIFDFCPVAFDPDPIPGPRTAENVGCLVILTPEGDMKLRLGDWVVRGVKGEYYPVRNDIFEVTYEPVKE